MGMKSDTDLKAELMETLDAIAAVKGANIEVDVEHGMVTLSGAVDTHQTRFQVERAARRVHGMRGLDIKVQSQANGKHKHH